LSKMQGTWCITPIHALSVSVLKLSRVFRRGFLCGK
jgi:hypothetical protein